MLATIYNKQKHHNSALTILECMVETGPWVFKFSHNGSLIYSNTKLTTPKLYSFFIKARKLARKTMRQHELNNILTAIGKG